jgi:hypothetical protein
LQNFSAGDEINPAAKRRSFSRFVHASPVGKLIGEVVTPIFLGIRKD